MAVLDDPMRFQLAGTLRLGVCRRRRDQETPHHGAPCHFWFPRTFLWYPGGEHGGGFPAVVESRADALVARDGFGKWKGGRKLSI